LYINLHPKIFKITADAITNKVVVLTNSSSKDQEIKST